MLFRSCQPLPCATSASSASSAVNASTIIAAEGVEDAEAAQRIYPRTLPWL